MADIWQQGSNRVRWMCVLPLLSMPDALDLLPWCKDNGAVGSNSHFGDQLVSSCGGSSSPWIMKSIR